jgi:hypothetical protein
METAHPAVVARLQALVEQPAEADALLLQWLRRFAAVSDRGLRRTVLGHLLAEADDGTLLGVLLRLEERAANGDAACRTLSGELALTPSVIEDLPYDRTVDLYASARAAGLPRLAARFLGRYTDDSGVAARNPHLERSPGERTAAARGRDRLTLDRLLHDRDPRVIVALLDNSRITERDVVRIAAMRPTSATILNLIAAHNRWGQLYRVRKALAFNPASPLSLARPLLPTLLRQHLVELATSQVVGEALRAEIKVLLGR